MSDGKKGLLSEGLYKRWKAGEFGFLETSVIIEAAKAAGFPVDDKGYLVQLQNEPKVVSLFKKIGTVPVEAAIKQYDDLREKTANLRKCNKRLIETNANFVEKLKTLEVESSVNPKQLSMEGIRDFREKLEGVWALFKEVQKLALPEILANASRYYDAALADAKGSAVAEENLAKAYAKLTSPDVTVAEAQTFVSWARAKGVKPARPGQQANTGNGSEGQSFNTPQIKHNPLGDYPETGSKFTPSTPRGQSKKDAKGKRQADRSA